MQWNAFLTFNGQCEAAFRFYAECFGGKIVTLLTWGASPMADQAPPGWAGKILHATLEAGGNVLSGYDAPPEQYEPPKGFNLQLNLEDPPKPSGSSTPWPKTAPCRCRCRRPFGPLAMGTLSIGSGFHGRLTANGRNLPRNLCYGLSRIAYDRSLRGKSRSLEDDSIYPGVQCVFWSEQKSEGNARVRELFRSSASGETELARVSFSSASCIEPLERADGECAYVFDARKRFGPGA